MKTNNLSTIILTILPLFYALPGYSSGIGFSFGSFIKASDFSAKEMQIYYDVFPDGPNIHSIFTTDSSMVPPGAQMSLMGGKSSSTYFGILLTHKLPVTGLETEIDAGIAFGAEQSVKPHTLLFSGNILYVLPVTPRIFIWNVRPLVGAGAGLFYHMGTNYGKYLNDLPYNSPQDNYPKQIGSHWSPEYNFSLGARVPVWEDWWFQLTLRDYIQPWTRRLPLFSIHKHDRPSLSPTEETTHSFSVYVSLLKIEYPATSHSVSNRMPSR